MHTRTPARVVTTWTVSALLALVAVALPSAAPQRRQFPDTSNRIAVFADQLPAMSGEALRFAVAFKPVATIFQPQTTVTREHQPVIFQPRGRHDPCVLPRAVPMVEAMAALVLCDHMLRARLARVQPGPQGPTP